MSKYKGYLGYPIMLLFVYLLWAAINWNRNPADWMWSDRFLWVAWGTIWGCILSLKIESDK
jgi:hypothetical protein